MEYVTIVLRVLHIFAAVFWVGSGWFSEFFMMPTAQALGPDASKFMGHLLAVRKLSLYISAAAGVTLVAGWILWLLRYNLASLSTGPGIVFLVGGVVGTVAGVVGGMVGGTAARIGALGAEISQQGKPPTPQQGAQMGALQARMARLGVWSAILTSLALLMMASARYL